jgi:hypothetical protein
MNIIMVVVELIPILLGFIFVVNILNEYKQFGLIIEKLNEGEKCASVSEAMAMASISSKAMASSEANKEHHLLSKQNLKEREQILKEREEALIKREQILKKREDIYTNSSEQYAKKLKTRFR